jgi:UDP-N-acetylmuramate-alanine ligase
MCATAAALAAADLLGLVLDEAAKALGDFRGTGRRFELRGGWRCDGHR